MTRVTKDQIGACCNQLAETLLDAAEFRKMKHEEYPQDGRNAAAARDLAVAAMWVGDMSPNHPLLVRWAEVVAAGIENDNVLLSEVEAQVFHLGQWNSAPGAACSNRSLRWSSLVR